ncbi:hypothetical protein AV540_07545 [Brevibacillus parabrevis]|uniref:hypothetical protein n=1 Tax=Brevibacillus parabrevis TaxID=54914 RepID=UPI0007ABEF23|nr:hypothetical protein [Brevibacillus parabrevis]KZE54068.1 hypothetical protein AV540_07545 [Brevibacillus parabrevis]
MTQRTIANAPAKAGSVQKVAGGGDGAFGAYKHFHIGKKADETVGLFCISRGLGTSRLPVRLCCFPEITVYQINHK